jgi:HEAT repeat protein
MNEPAPAAPTSRALSASAPKLSAAFEALKTYDYGSDRGALLPIDEVVAATLNEGASQKTLESQLLDALRTCRSAVAAEYVCGKLVLVGSAVSAVELAKLLADPQLSTAARNALEAISGPSSSKALRTHLAKLSGAQKVGVINSLGAPRDPDSVSVLAAVMNKESPDVAGAAAAALGEIATGKAAQALEKFLPQCPSMLRDQLADAVLICAERLFAEGHKSQAQTLYQKLRDAPCAQRFKDAATQGLRACGRKP